MDAVAPILRRETFFKDEKFVIFPKKNDEKKISAGDSRRKCILYYPSVVEPEKCHNIELLLDAVALTADF